ncbi:hypothetical protein LGK95_12895 [Clostridium algoriphilum]|uniref:hypothetical protein n=1 Tax=Clostridium algoriphilum TaxID=198347 RepID=UPI001CF5CD2C|nr:hypothetical protein [Clostridium algoriphilum]MCB2294407.1 hypothetical protein [Clostridium algoriphilum]
MRGIYIPIKKDNSSYNKDIMDTSYEERLKWYNTLSKGQIMSVLEQFVTNKTMIHK